MIVRVVLLMHGDPLVWLRERNFMFRYLAQASLFGLSCRGLAICLSAVMNMMAFAIEFCIFFGPGAVKL